MTHTMVDDPSDGETRRQILEAVARGELSPEEAARRLRDGSGSMTATSASDGEAGSAEPAGGRRVEVHVQACSAQVVADPAVMTVAVEGRHELREELDALIVELEPDLDDDDELGDERRRVGVFMIGGRRVGRLPFGPTTGKRVVRVHPEAPLTVRVNAGAANVSGIRAPLRVEVAAGTVKVGDFCGSVSGVVSAGSLKLDGAVVGDGDLRVEAGSVRMALRPDSDVEVSSDMSMGSALLGTGSAPLVVGGGHGRLRINGSLSSVKVTCVD